jgi:two-component system response regulator HydG
VYQPILLGKSKIMQGVRDQIKTLAALPWHVRIEGPSGSGKNLAARLLHALSPLAHGPLVVCSLAMLPDGMELAELVGYRRGAFTGAVQDHAGVFERAHNGTLFLDELATASETAQAALLQLVDEQPFHRTGDKRTLEVKVRIVFATNADLEARVACGAFREDLFRRLGLLVVQMPALADHRDDIPELAEHILSEKSHQARRPVVVLSTEQMELLISYAWPGNVRQLEKTIEHFVAYGRLPEVLARLPRPSDWRERVVATLLECGGNKSAAARALGVPRSMLYAELSRREA